MAFKWFSTSSRFRNFAGYDFYFVEYKFFRFTLVNSLFNILREIFLSSLG